MAPPTVFLTYQGQTRSQAAWAKLLHIPEQRISRRRRQGLSDAQCLTTTRPPPRPTTPLRYCRTHELAWCEATAEGPHWHPLAKSTVWYALRLAHVFGCAGQIRLEDTRCDRCAAEGSP